MPFIKVCDCWIFIKNFVGISIYPFIFLKKSFFESHKDEFLTILNHERIHIKQQKETGIILYFIWYGMEFFIRYIGSGFDFYFAYLNISFEKEAYKNENDVRYLKKRKKWAFLSYM